MTFLITPQTKVPVDPLIGDVSLLLHGDGTNGAQNNTFLDSSTNNFTITRTGNTTQGSFSPFGKVGGSAYFDGTSDYLTIPDNNNFNFGSGNFTIETWVRFSVSTSGVSYFIASQADNNYATNCSWSLLRHETNKLRFISTSDGGFTGVVIVNSVNDFLPQVNTWYHLAAVRLAGTIKLYLDGVEVGSGTNSTTFFDSTRVVGIGASSNGEGAINGYISNLRILKGTALYTSNFTPPTAPLTAITNTSLLLNFTNAGIVDSAAKNNLETVGNAQISTAQSKFGGGSIAFDGTGDYLTYSPTLSTAFGTGDFTVETWIYRSSSSGAAFYILDNRNSGQTTNWALFRNGFSQLEWFTGSASITGSSGPGFNQWDHVAYCRSGTTGRLFINGTQVASGTDSTNYSVASTVSYVGCRFSVAEFITGYIDDLRITKYARYTSNFTPPTAPFGDI